MFDSWIARSASDASYKTFVYGQRLTGPMAGYTVDKVFNDPSTGLQAYAFRNEANGNVIMAMRGTEDLRDAIADGRLGLDQYLDNSGLLLSYLNQYKAAHPAAEILITGHSLGGGLAQYLAYDFERTHGGAALGVSLVTFNGLSGKYGVEKTWGYDPKVLQNVSAKYYFHPDDVVSRIGGGYLAGQTLRVPDLTPGPDGLSQSHLLPVFTPETLRDAVAATPRYYAVDLTSKILASMLSDQLETFDNPNATPAEQGLAVGKMYAILQFVPPWEKPAFQQLIRDVVVGQIRDTIHDAMVKSQPIIDKVHEVLEVTGVILDALKQQAEQAIIEEIGRELKLFIDLWFNSLGSGLTVLASPDDRTGFTGVWCCVSVDQAGRWAAFESTDSQIDRRDTNGKADIFIYQLKEYIFPVGSIQRISNGYDGKEGNGDSFNPNLSPEGDWVAFTSFASNLARGDTNNVTDVFLAGIDHRPELISLANDGSPGNGPSYFAVVSGNAAQIAFVSEASNLVAGDLNGVADIFLRERDAATTERISVGLNGAAANGASTMPAISADGRYVAFVSAASNIVAGDSNGVRDIFVYDRQTHAVERVSLAARGVQSNADSWAPVMTPDGRYVAFYSAASTLVANDTNGKSDIFVYDRVTDTVSRVSVGLGGAQANGDSGGKPIAGPVPGNAWGLAISADGQKVAFISAASNLVAGDTNGQTDVFLYDRATGTTLRIDGVGGPQASGGPLGSSYAGAVAMSGDASIIAYISDATNLTANDTNPQPDVFVFQANDHVTPKVGTLTAETLAGTALDDFLGGLSGNDTLNGLAGDDRLFGGAGDDVVTGGDGNDELSGGGGTDRLVGGRGNDVYLVETGTEVLVESARQGRDEIRSKVSMTMPANFESIVLLGTAGLSAQGGTGNDRIAGNAGGNVITGGAGRDLVSGAAGNDRLSGDADDDRLVGDAGGDTLMGGTGRDILEGGLDPDALFGEAGDDQLLGQDGVDVLDGGEGSDLLDGGLGGDRMTGGAGADTYVVDSVGDRLIETGSDRDTIQAFLSYRLPDLFENLELMGAASSGTGNALNNQIAGNDLANALDGGAGNDSLAGGKGDDVYIVDSQSDVVRENAGEGFDLVRSSTSHILRANVEGLILGGTDNNAATGNGLDNTIFGNAGNNRIDGQAGADRLLGGAGNDIYFLDNVGDTVTENAGEGHDLVEQELAAYTLPAHVEDLRLYVGGQDNGARNATGNALDNLINGSGGANVVIGMEGNDRLFGFGGNDRLDGWDGNDMLDGGFGDDLMIGRAGDDSFTVDSSGDVVLESANQGTDQVLSSISFRLSANVENLTLANGRAVDGTGNGLNNRIVGNSSHNVLDGGAGADILEGGGGNDTYRVDRADDRLVELSGYGTDTVVSAVSWTLATAFENLTLTGSDNLVGNGNEVANTIVGNAGTNVLQGFAGNDTLDGGAGSDVMYGGAGLDTYVVDSSGDRAIELSGTERDTIVASISWALPGLIEDLVLTGSATTGTGNSDNNQITGNDLANMLDGAGGNDVLSGGKGSDNYYVDSLSDIVRENSGEGTDTVRSTVSHFLRPNVENLVLVGSGDDNATGNELVNLLYGNMGANTLDGRGGADIMVGLGGNDAYIADQIGDRAVEAVGGGNDRVLASASFVLERGSEIELLKTTSDGGTAAINLTGNEFANLMYGNAGSNVLDGGGRGDIMIGLRGNDIYVVDSADDRVVEAVGGGDDRVLASASFVLEPGSEVEGLTTTDDIGGGAINLTGNGFGNIIRGNAGNNVLDGGAGADVLVGLAGDDSYAIDNAGDRALEAVGGGFDRVLTSTSFALEAGAEIELLTTTSGAGIAPITLVGNEFANIIFGNDGSNAIKGGLGNDTLAGLGGSDAFVFNTALHAVNNVDRIIDFNPADDDIILAASMFPTIAAGALSASAFHIGAASHAPTDRILYNSATGALTYDPDGTDAGAPIQFAMVTAGLALTSADFIVV